jgi:hypothetical protein
MFGGVVLVALWLGAPAPSQADFLAMKLPEGTFNVSGFDYGRGNMLVTGVPATGLATGAVLEVYSQSTVNAVLGTNGLPIAGLGLNATYELTAVARFTEVVTSVTPTANGAIVTFALNPVQTNPFFEVWFHNGILADNFAGTGFNAGTKILSGVIGSVNSSVFQTTITNLQFIDNPNTSGGTTAGKNFWNGGIPPVTATGTLTATDSGTTDMSLATMQVNSVVLNPAFFPGGQTVTSYNITPDSNLEYKQAALCAIFSHSGSENRRKNQGSQVIMALLTGAANLPRRPPTLEIP